MSRLQHKRGRKSNYVKNNVSSESHKAARMECLKRENNCCKICSSKTNLELHHISYHIKGKELENLKWVVILCANCHQESHDDMNHKYNPKNPFKRTV